MSRTFYLGVCMALVIGCGKPPPKTDLGLEEDMTMAEPDLSMGSPDLTMGGEDMTMTGDMAQGGGDMAQPGDMAQGGDMTQPGDMAQGGDMAQQGDMAQPGDMAQGGDMAMNGDMAQPGDMAMGGDMTRPGDMTMGGDGGGMGGIGAPCTADANCTAGPSPVCWRMNVGNNNANPRTPGGYCSSSCTSNADCGGAGTCVNLGAGRFCLASCNAAGACRSPGYACAYLGAAGVCYSEDIFDCDPTANMGNCTESGTMKAGGCLRGAYDNKGRCSASCTVGAGTCQPRGAQARQCIYLPQQNATDPYKGTLCVSSPAMPVQPGGMCTYLNDCTDGYQCDGQSDTCKQLCVKGGMPACGMGMMCADAFMTAANGPGICR